MPWYLAGSSSTCLLTDIDSVSHMPNKSSQSQNIELVGFFTNIDMIHESSSGTTSHRLVYGLDRLKVIQVWNN